MTEQAASAAERVPCTDTAGFDAEVLMQIEDGLVFVTIDDIRGRGRGYLTPDRARQAAAALNRVADALDPPTERAGAAGETDMPVGIMRTVLKSSQSMIAQTREQLAQIEAAMGDVERELRDSDRAAAGERAERIERLARQAVDDFERGAWSGAMTQLKAALAATPLGRGGGR